MTPREVRRRYSKGRDLDVVLRKGYRKRGMCAICVSAVLLAPGCETYRSETSHASQCGMQHIGGALAHCTHGSKQQRSAATG